VQGHVSGAGSRYRSSDVPHRLVHESGNVLRGNVKGVAVMVEASAQRVPVSPAQAWPAFYLGHLELCLVYQPARRPENQQPHSFVLGSRRWRQCTEGFQVWSLLASPFERDLA
jgi:hypothetical protein